MGYSSKRQDKKTSWVQNQWNETKKEELQQYIQDGNNAWISPQPLPDETWDNK